MTVQRSDHVHRKSSLGWMRGPFLFCCGMLVLFSLALLSIALSESFLMVRTPKVPVDVIVVLGGDGPTRAWHAAALYRAGLAPKVLVSGDGDCLSIRDRMAQNGVPAAAITVECASGDTFQNADYSAPVLKAMGARSMALVTSWFHSRRALACFHKAVPAIALHSWPVEPPVGFRAKMQDRDRNRVVLEYAKLGYYVPRFLIDPTLGFGRALASGRVTP